MGTLMELSKLTCVAWTTNGSSMRSDSTVIERSKRMLKRCKADTFLFQADGGAEGGVDKIPVKVLLVRSEPA
jgi:hypothetical protein